MSSVPQSATISDERLSIATKVAFGAGDFGTAVVAALKAFFLLFFLTDVARLSPGAAGSILFIIKVWDAVNDPLVGWLSDRTQTRWGRRRPWILFGALPFGLFFTMLWLTPELSDTGKYIYYLIVAALGDTTFTIVNVPYAALTPELTRDYDERTSLNSYRFGFSILGGLIAAVLHPIIVGQFADPRTGYMVSAIVWGIAVTLPCFVVVAGTRERPESVVPVPESERISYGEQVRIAFANTPYRYVIGLYLLSWLALQIIATVLAFYMRYYMVRPGQLALILGIIQISAFLGLILWGSLSRRLDKRRVYLLGASLWLAVQISIYFITPEQFTLLMPLAALAGIGAATAYLIPWAMVPDVIEFDEWETGQRREGIFYGFMVFLQKLGLALGIFLVGLFLDMSGYITPTDAVPSPVQPEGALQAIRVFIGPVPAVILALSLLLVYGYPITRAKHAEMRAALAERRDRGSRQ